MRRHAGQPRAPRIAPAGWPTIFRCVSGNHYDCPILALFATVGASNLSLFRMNLMVEVRGAHSSKTAKGGASPFWKGVEGWASPPAPLKAMETEILRLAKKSAGSQDDVARCACQNHGSSKCSRFVIQNGSAFVRGNPGLVLAEQAHESGGGEIRDQEGGVTQSGHARHALRRHITTAHGAFHGGGPAGGGPVSGKKDTWPDRLRPRAKGVDAGSRGIRCVNFLDDRGFHQVRRPRLGKELAQFSEREVDNLSPRFFNQTFGRAHHEFYVAAVSLRG